MSMTPSAASTDRPRVVVDELLSQKRLATEEHTKLAKAVDLHTISRITQIWSDRLQLISVYASFFTSIDSVLFSLASSNKGSGSTTRKLMLATLIGALIFHASTAILAYVASFVLIRYRLNDAQSTPRNPKSSIAAVYARHAPPGSTVVDRLSTPSGLESGNSGPHEKVEHIHNSHSFASPHTAPFLSTFFAWPSFFHIHPATSMSLPDQSPLLNIDIRRVSVFNFGVPCFGTSVHDGDPNVDAEKNAIALVRLLNRCHSVCSFFALTGFLLVITGIVAYVWAVLEHSVAIFGSACVGICIIMGLVALL